MSKEIVIIILLIILLYFYFSRREKLIMVKKKTDENREQRTENREQRTENREQRTEKSPVRKIEKEKDCWTLQECLCKFNELAKVIGGGIESIFLSGVGLEIELSSKRSYDISGEYIESLEGGKLDLLGFPNLISVVVFGEDLKSPITELDVSNCPKLEIIRLEESNLTELDVSHNPKLTDLFVDAKLFYPENKIKGLEKTSIIRLDCQEGDLLRKSDNPQFIWDVFIRKYNVTFPEMKLIKIDDLTELAQQVNSETINDEKFLRKFSSEKFIEEENFRSFYWVLDNLANQILGRCLIIMNRLYTDKDEVMIFDEGDDCQKKVNNNQEYEAYLMELAQDLHCKAMNPKYPEASLYSNRERLVNQALSGDKELLKRLQDLPYLNPKYKFKEIK